MLADGADTRHAIRASIAEVAIRLRLAVGHGPSSTVLIAQLRAGVAEIAVLGDSTAIVDFRNGRTERLTDDRITRVAPDLRARYRGCLRAGHGFDDTHAALLRDIQRAERAARNRPGGYWIAEADPTAAEHAAVRRYPVDDIEWCILATDGAQRPYDHRGGDWSALLADAHGLRRCLEQLHEWEAALRPRRSTPAAIYSGMTTRRLSSGVTDLTLFEIGGLNRAANALGAPAARDGVVHRYHGVPVGVSPPLVTLM